MRTYLMIILLVMSLLAGLFTTPAVDAQRPDAPPYALRGPYAVGTMEFQVTADDDRVMNATVWYPALNPDELEAEVTYTESLARLAGQALRDAAPDMSNAPYPLVIFSHGLGGFRFQSVFFVEHLASYGFIVIATEHPGSTVVDAVRDELTTETILQNFALRPLDILQIIAHAETMHDTGSLAGMIDLDQIAVAGHSFGGYTALAAGGAQLDPALLQTFCNAAETTTVTELDSCNVDLAQFVADWRQLDGVPDGLFPPTTDPRIKAMVLLAPWGETAFTGEGLAAVDVPALILVGSNDASTPPETNAYPIYEGISSEDKSVITFANAGHFIFVEACSDQMIAFGFFDSCSDDVWDMQRAHEITNHLVTAFLLDTLKGDAEASTVFDQINFPGIEYQTSR